MRKFDNIWTLSVAGSTMSALTALVLSAPSAQADPDVAAPLPGPAPTEQSITTQAAADDPAAPPAEPTPPPEVQHLSSPQNLPPGTTDVPVDQGQSRTGSYLRDLWHAVQTQNISGKDALLLLTQRPLDANAMPTNGLPSGPQAPPGTPAAPGAPADLPAPPAPGPPPTP